MRPLAEPGLVVEESQGIQPEKTVDLQPFRYVVRTHAELREHQQRRAAPRMHSSSTAKVPLSRGVLYSACPRRLLSPWMNRLRWRDYHTAKGARPVKAFIDALTDEEAAAIIAAMKEVAKLGLAAARHLRGAIYEVHAESETRSFRVLFAQETKFILLSLHGLQKKTQKTPPREIEVAEQRLKDWRGRGIQ
jgi:phage-related protein